MKQQIKKVIETMADKASNRIGNENNSNNALKYSQAALNLAHVLEILQNLEKSNGA